MTPIPIQPILNLLQAAQCPEGTFPGNTPTLFGTLLTVSILAEMTDYESAGAMCMRSLPYIESKQQNDGSYRYGDPYPPDLDDTALAAAAAIRFDQVRFGGTALSQLIKLLTSAEVAEGGPYNTWLTEHDSDPRWHDVDLGVNANIAYALSLLHVDLPNLQRLFDAAIERGEYESRYYHLPLMVLFFISRSYGGHYADRAVDFILALRCADGTWGTATETAAALCALSNFKHDITVYGEEIERLVNAVDTLRADPLYRERVCDLEIHYYENRSVSLAIIALAAYRFNVSLDRNNAPENNQFPYGDHEKVVCAAFSAECALAGYGTVAAKHLELLQSTPISTGAASLPLVWWNAMIATDHPVSIEAVENLSKAHIYGWIGYGIIDAIMDEESSTGELPFALFCIRSFSTIYLELFPNERYEFFSHIVNGTELAFFQECEDRLRSADQNSEWLLASIPARIPVSWQKSFGYALPALALLLLSGYTPDSPAYTHMELFFKSFLHARQLHDDSHDFIEDITSGRVTVVGKLLLQHFKERYPECDLVSIPRNTTALQALFWEACFPAIDEMIETSIADACTHLLELPLIDRTYFESMLFGLRTAQTKARDERTKMLDFIRSY